MKNKILLEIIIVLSFIYMGIGSFKKETSFFNEDSPNYVKVKDNEEGSIKTYPIEEYLIGVLAGEMPASFEEEALKAQAIASRTFAYYMINNSQKDYDVTNDTTSQVHLTYEEMHSNWGEDYDYYLNKITKAINDTKDMVMTYNNEIIASFYYSMSNGYTEDPKEVFGISKDYLKPVESKVDMLNTDYEITSTLNKQDFCQILGINCNNIVISDISLTPSYRVSTLKINDTSYTGVEIRNLLNLRSTDFTITEDDTNVYITTKGYGHGVGMSQYGAQGLAKEGYNYLEILNHYYQNITLKNINDIY